MSPHKPITYQSPVMDMLQKQLNALNTAVDVTGDQWEDLWDLRESVMEMVPPDGSFDKRLVDKLIHLQKDLEVARDTTRQIINEMQRPFLRPLTILDLPDELLHHIFRQLGMLRTIKGYKQFGQEEERETDRVKKLRLTCRRFCETFSPLLMRNVSVELTQESLDHLSEVSRHPTISKGIRRVQIELRRHFKFDIANDMQVFARYGAANLRAHIEWYWKTDFGASSLDSVRKPEKVFQKARSRATLIAEAFEKAAQHGLDEKDPVHTMLKRAQECYRQGYESQLLLQRGPFAQAIVSAMQRMPTTTRLSVGYAETSPFCRSGRIEPEDLEDLDALRVPLQVPCSTFWWPGGEFTKAMSAPLGFLPGLISSLGHAEISLDEMIVWTYLPDDLSTLSTDQLEPAKPQQQLRAFTFYPCCDVAPPIEQIPHLTSFMSTVLQILSLQRIDISFSFMCRGTTRPTVSMATALLSCNWPSLKELCFNGPFCFEDLRQLVSHINVDAELQWSGYLIDGSWAEVLDFLRSCGLHAAITLGIYGDWVGGAECENMSQEEIDFIFDGHLSGATKFIRRLETQNPIAAWANGELEIPVA